MKKTLIAIIMSIAISVQAFAAQDIIVNHVKKTVTIQANFVSVAPITETLHQAAELWNSRSGKYFCNIDTNDGLEKYTVNFKVVVNNDMTKDLASNVITILPNNHKLFNKSKTTNYNDIKVTKKTVCITDGKVIGISEAYKNNKYVLAHEMGHNLGLKHAEELPCCHFGSKDIAIFEITSSVTQLANANSEKDSTTGRRIELFALGHDYGFEKAVRG